MSETPYVKPKQVVNYSDVVSDEDDPSLSFAAFRSLKFTEDGSPAFMSLPRPSFQIIGIATGNVNLDGDTIEVKPFVTEY